MCGQRREIFSVNHVVKWRTWTDLRRCVSACLLYAAAAPPDWALGFQFNWLSIWFTVATLHNNRTLLHHTTTVYSLGLTVELIWPGMQKSNSWRRRRSSCRWRQKSLWMRNGFWQLLATMTSLQRSRYPPTSSRGNSINRRRSAVVKVHLKKHAPNQTQSIVRFDGSSVVVANIGSNVM